MSVRTHNYQSLAIAVGIWVGVASADFLAFKALFLLLLLIPFRKSAFAPVLLAMVTGVIAFLVHAEALSRNSINDFVDSAVEIEGVVSSDPNRTRERVIGSRISSAKTTFLMRAEVFTTNGRTYRTRIPVRVIVDSQLTLIPSERIRINGQLIATKERRVAAMLIGDGDSLLSLGAPRAFTSLEKVRVALRREAEYVGGESAALIPGMVIGDTSLQSPELTKLMLQAGLSHLTAVSGANFAIVSAFIFAIIGVFFPNRRIQVLFTIFALTIFVFLVRPTPSVLRAGVMAAVFLIAKLSGRRSAGINSLAFAISLLLLINPFQAFEAGFILSVLATSGLLFLAPSIAARVPGPKFLGELVSIPMAATLFCSPYLMLISGGLNLGSILLNILVAPAVPFITILGFIATLIAIPFGSLARQLLELANLGTSWILYVASWSEAMPSLVTSAPALILIGLCVVIAKLFGFRSAAIFIVVIIGIGSFQKLLFPGSEWKVGQCDVGQGDALLVNLGGGSAILFDAGPEPRLLDRCLDLFQVKELPLVVISHAHADHYQGLEGIGKREVGEIWSNRAVDYLAPALKATNHRVARDGLISKVGPATVEIIWPETGDESFQSVAGDGSTENNRSVVAIVEINRARLLVTGDIEPGAQEQLLDEISNIDLIKVPHHGSKHQELELFAGASMFLVSVGPNSYGHPDVGLISRLENLGSVFRSDLDGSIALGWRIDSTGKPIFSARLLGKEWWRISWH